MYGSNEIIVPIHSIITLLFLEVLNPFYVFQLFSFCLWFADDYMYYALAILAMSVFGIVMAIIQTRKVSEFMTAVPICCCLHLIVSCFRFIVLCMYYVVYVVLCCTTV